MANQFKGFEGNKSAGSDEIVTSSQRLMVWLTRNATLLSYAGGGLLFLLLLIAGLALVKSNRAASANLALVDAVNLYQPLAQRSEAAQAATLSPDRLHEALASFREVEAKYRGMAQGKAAALYAANILFTLGSYREAATAVEDLAARDAAFVQRFGGTYLLAKSYEAAKDYPKALASFASVRDRSAGDMRGQVLVDMARCSALSGDTAAAIELYQKVKGEFPSDNPLFQRADKMLVLLEAGAPSRP